MVEYTWAVWRDCRLVAYIKAFSETDALRKATEVYGPRVFVERTPYLPVASHT